MFAPMLDFEKPITRLEERIALLRGRLQKRRRAKGYEKQLRKLEDELDFAQKNIYANVTPWQSVQLSRHPMRPYTLDYILGLCSSFVEVHGDRAFGDDRAMVCGIGEVQGQSIFFIGHQKGRTTKERQERNFGMAMPHGYRKALRVMKLAEKFNKPIVVFIDTPGAYPGIEAEEGGQAHAIATNIQAMFSIRVPIICIVIGEGASGGALALGVGDRVLMLENSWYSVITPESCSSILWKNWDNKELAAAALQLTAQEMLANGLIDGIISEPLGGAHKNYQEMMATMKEAILVQLDKLKWLSIEELLKKREKKFITIGGACL